MAGEPLLRQQILGVVLVDERWVEHGARKEAAAAACVALAQAIGAPLLDLKIDRESAPLIGENGAISRVAELKKRVLLVCGGLLEGAVTQVALNALVDGFDVFIGADLVWSAEPERESLFFDRIAACCGNILTRRQIVLELLAQETDPERRKNLMSLIEGASG